MTPQHPRELSGEECYEEQKRRVEEEELDRELQILLDKHNAGYREGFSEGFEIGKAQCESHHGEIVCAPHTPARNDSDVLDNFVMWIKETPASIIQAECDDGDYDVECLSKKRLFAKIEQLRQQQEQPK